MFKSEDWRAFRKRRLLFAAWCLAALLAVLLTLRLSVFMMRPEKTAWSVLPKQPGTSEHTCLSAYVIAAHIAGSEENIYDLSLYRQGKENVDHGISLGGFNQDFYQYPPQFLLLPRALLVLTKDFLTLRKVWFLLQIAVTLAILILAARWIGGREGWILALLIPFFWIPHTHLYTLQIGNIHIVAIAFAVLAMILFEKGHHVAGGAILSFVILGKMFPGILIVYLLCARRFRPVLWTAGFGVVYSLLTWIVFGTGSTRFFVTYQIPQLLSGEAFAFFLKAPWIGVINMSAGSLGYKLAMVFGLLLEPEKWASVLSPIYLVLVIGSAVALGLKKVGASQPAAPSGVRLRHLQVWLVLLSFGSLQSPFVPISYALHATLWLLLSLTPLVAHRRWTLRIAWPLLWVLFSYHLLIPPINLLVFLLVFAMLFMTTAYLYRSARPTALKTTEGADR